MDRLPASAVEAISAQLAHTLPHAVYLFGSYGTDRAHPGSDMDLAVLPATRVEPASLFRLAGTLSGSLGIEVDLIDLTQASTVMAKEVLRTGERVLCGNQLTAEIFEMRTLADYARLNEERQACLTP